MNIHPLIMYTRRSNKISKNLWIAVVVFLLCACSQRQVNIPQGTVAPWGSLDSLIDRSLSQEHSRKDDIEIRLDLAKQKVGIGENIKVKISLKNKTTQDIIVRRLDATPVSGSEFEGIKGLEFLVLSLETGLGLEREASFLSGGLTQESFPPPESFMTLFAGDTFAVNFDLIEIFPPILAGSYTIQVTYNNNYFGAGLQTDSDYQFIDYNAWIGTISSNVERFQVVP